MAKSKDDKGKGKSAPGKKELRKKLRKLRRKLKAAQADLASALGTPHKVSPLAPKAGFPDLPVINGVEFSAAEAGVKYIGRLDVMLARIAPGSSLAGVFTRSSTRSAPVLDCQNKLAGMEETSEDGFAILVNSGNSNAFTGAVGVEAVKATTGAVAASLHMPEAHVFTASTGVIGEPLPAERITAVVDQLRDTLSPDLISDAARAIMTTDTFPKGAGTEISIDGKRVSIAGFAKGSGMIAPDMATMLVFIFTDAAIAQTDLQAMLSELNETTFNAITVDSDTSTSDSLLLAATCASGVHVGSKSSRSGQAFAEGLQNVMQDLALQVVRDGEGASKLVEVTVTGASDDAAAKQVALSIANSPLVKTAVAGEDPNWGRVVMAVGKSGAPAERDLITIRFGDILVAENGWVAQSYTEEAGAAYMKQDELLVAVDLGLGTGRSTVWTCDLTKQYVSINADYRS